MKVLLASTDSGIVAAAKRVATDLEFNLVVCEGLMGAFEVLGRREFDIAILDCEDMELAAQLIAGVPVTNSGALKVLAIAPQDYQPAGGPKQGPCMLLHRPVSAQNISRSIRTLGALSFRADETSLGSR